MLRAFKSLRHSIDGRLNIMAYDRLKTSPGNPVMRTFTNEHNGFTWVSHWLWCPGCEQLHPLHSKATEAENVWKWNGNEPKPTFEGSYFVWEGPEASPTKKCHSYIKAGNWEFLSDCTHKFAGKVVSLPPLPDFLMGNAKAMGK